MSFFRNREVRRFCIIYGSFSLVFIAAGAFIHIAAAALVTAVCFVFGVLFFVFTKARYQKIASLCQEIDQVLHSNEILDTGNYNEGELSLLQNEIYKMTIMLRQQAENLKEDKIYLQHSIADISHQLKTPLTSMNMIASFLGKPDIGQDSREKLTHELLKLLSRINWLITTLLKISQLDTGTVRFKKDSIPVSVLIEKTVEPFIIPLEIRNISLHVTHNEECFTGDLSWYSEALGNIMKNCIEYTPNGGIITVDCSQNSIYTQIIIKDNGKGIEKDDLPHLFERFYRGKKAADDSFGIGLSLAKMIIVRQNGTIQAGNNKDGGACFTIKIYHTK